VLQVVDGLHLGPDDLVFFFGFCFLLQFPGLLLLEPEVRGLTLPYLKVLSVLGPLFLELLVGFLEECLKIEGLPNLLAHLGGDVLAHRPLAQVHLPVN